MHRKTTNYFSGSDPPRTHPPKDKNRIMKRVFIILVLMISTSVLLISTPVHAEDSTITAPITGVDVCGDFTLELTSSALRAAGFSPGDLVRIIIDNNSLDVLITSEYCLIPVGDVYVYLGEDDSLVTIEGNLVYTIEKMGLATRGPDDDRIVWYSDADLSEVTIDLIQKNADPLIARTRELVRTNDRTDYSSDAVFANFREVRVGSIAPGILYRSCSPIDDYLGRSEVADRLAEAAGIQTFLNLCNSYASLQRYIIRSGDRCSYYARSHVITSWFAQDFTNYYEKQKLGRVLTDLANSEPPYLIHCVEGKDRTGFVCVLLGMLMDGSVEEIEEDYRTSFINYFHLESNPELSREIGHRMVSGIMKQIGNPYDYLLSCGMDEETIELLKMRLAGEEELKKAS